ncbi:uncharacterized protein LOC100826333 [Brachypodium distachyon]|uniref:VQ domain-containing protein n=1 Tax=Brachypodium distachyon TaxID=15368 RepID=I1HI61_BRADI|nr:uncharacterized protein LOC100826333 [Brachypodium distachyon]KQK05646.1 hypothetical protein BRADI_2g21400v3 [Brachypodium distachyon]|eukprot:XP_003566100.1 uncharacterized protein LOC100826333 [Brachypodium distachyon]
MEKKAQCGAKSNVAVHRGATAGGSGKQRKRKGGGEPIKVVYVNNPMRVTTDAAGFRALVQELTGRHADPAKYGAGTVSGESSGSPAGPRMAPSPGSTEESSDGAGSGAGACHDDFPAPPPACYGYGYDDEESFAPQLIDNRYSVFSPPTFLYASSHNEP